MGRQMRTCRLLCGGKKVWNCRVMCVEIEVWSCRVLCVGDRWGIVGYFVCVETGFEI